MLLDLGLPDRDGMELVPLLKAMDRAVIVMTARDATAEKVTALDLGADDYVVKPFDTEELLARIRSALRHRMPTASTSGVVTIGALSINILAHRVMRQGQEIRLTRKEFAVLANWPAILVRWLPIRICCAKFGERPMSPTSNIFEWQCADCA